MRNAKYVRIWKIKPNTEESYKKHRRPKHIERYITGWKI